jgi:CheY-like chemotaxis protein
MAGDHLAEKISRIRGDVPIILCTGFSQALESQRMKEVGIRRTIKKPIVEWELEHEIREQLDAKRGSAG